MTYPAYPRDPLDPRDPDDPRGMHQRMVDGDLYLADDPEIVFAYHRASDLTSEFNATTAREVERRRALLAELLGEIGEDTEIRPPLQVDYGTQITIGSRSFVNFGLIALDVVAITIGDDVQIGPNCQLLTPIHPLGADLRRAKWESAKPITIGDNVWLGGGVIVCPGVTIGANTVVGAGSVVTKDLPAGVLAVGNPARVVRELD
ncbi:MULTISPECIES: sugar O-acetyltransferase [unclassified Nocardioides]|uniref:sugar O-acetyltransferase n=1 Tax=unclassified Nocardioides TaxID=2615069 RepID=UPI000AAC41E3|nr:MULTISPECIES: sugar O-acetyltransferase [unclassified Nocardioides]